MKIFKNIRYSTFFAIIGYFAGVQLHLIATDQMLKEQTFKYLMLINVPIVSSIIYSVYFIESGVYHRIGSMAVAPFFLVIFYRWFDRSNNSIQIATSLNAIKKIIFNALNPSHTR